MLDYNDLSNILNCIYNSIPIQVKVIDHMDRQIKLIEGTNTTRIYNQIDNLDDMYNYRYTIKIGMA